LAACKTISFLACRCSQRTFCRNRSRPLFLSLCRIFCTVCNRIPGTFSTLSLKMITFKTGIYNPPFSPPCQSGQNLFFITARTLMHLIQTAIDLCVKQKGRREIRPFFFNHNQACPERSRGELVEWVESSRSVKPHGDVNSNARRSEPRMLVSGTFSR